MKTEVSTQIPVIVGKAATWSTYFTSAGLLVGSAMDWLNQNASAVGVIIAICTFCLNWYYQRKRLKMEREKNENAG